MGQVHPLAPGNEPLPVESRLILLRLVEQVDQLVARFDRLSASVPFADASGGIAATESPASHATRDKSARLTRAIRPPLPDPRLVRQIMRNRQLRARFFDGELFADPAWDILLDLVVARAEHKRVSVTSLCIASAVPPTTALRWIAQMVEEDLIARVNDEVDRRRAFIVLTDKAVDAIARYFAAIDSAGASVV
jgi:hypothetical protein